MLRRIKRFFLALFGKLETEELTLPEEEEKAAIKEPEEEEKEAESEPEEEEEEETVFISEAAMLGKSDICKTCGSKIFEDEGICHCCGEEKIM